MTKNCKYCGRRYEFIRPRSLFCSANCRVKHHLLSKEFIRIYGSEVNSYNNMLYYKQVYQNMGISGNCIKWVRQYDNWYNMWRRKDCKVIAGNDVAKFCKDCSHNVNHNVYFNVTR